MPGVGLDSSSQLDELLRELLNEVSSKDSKLWSKDGLNEDGSQNGSITTQSGNSRTIISWQTNPSGPRKAVTVTKHLADCYSGNEQWNTMNTGSKYSEEQSTSSYEKSEAHLATVKYTDAVDSVWKESRSATHGRPAKTPPPPPPVRRRLTSTNGLRMEMLGSSTEDKTQWERRDYSDTATKDLLGRNWASDSEDTRSWLDEQMWRLQTKKSGKSYQQHTQLERQLVADLKERLGLGGKELTQRGIEESSQRKTSSTSSSPPPLPPQRSKDSQSHVVSISFDDVTDLRSPSSSRAASNVVVNQTQSQNDLEVHHLQWTPTPSPKNRTSTGDDRTMSSSSLHAFHTAALDDETVTTIARSSTPMGRMEPPLKRSSSLKARASFYVSGIERPAFSTHQTKYTFSVNPVHLEDPEHTSRLPPVPPHRPGAPTSPVTPKRSDSSREAVLKSQRKLVCSQSPNEFENSLRLIMEHKPQTHSSTPDRAAVDQRKVASTPARDLGDEVIVLKPIGPGIQALEPDNTGTLKKPMTSLISLSASSIVDQTLRKNPASPVWTSADNINSQQGHLNRQCQLNVQYSSMTAKKSQLPSNTATQVAQPFGVGNANAIATEQQQLWQQQTLPHQQQRQQYFQQSYAQQHPWQQHLVQQPLIAQQYVSLQPWQQQTQPWQQQSWQQQTWQQQQQQSRLLQQQLYASPGLSFSQNPEDVQMTAQTIEFAQQRGVRQRSNVAQHESQALSVGVPKNWPSDGGPLQQNNSCNTLWNQEPFVQNTHQDVQFNMLQHNLQKSQNLNTEQFGSQHLGSQTLNDQQMMSPSLWNTQLLGGQITHQSNTQPMGVYQSTPQLSAGVQQHERSKYVTVEASTLSQDGTLRPSGWQPQFDASNICIPQQMQLTCVQNQGQLMQQQMHFQQQQQQQQMLQQQNQQQQQQQLYSRTLHSSLEDQIQNRRQVDKSWMTLGNSVKSPAAPLGSPVAVGSWPSVGYSDNLQFQRTVTNPPSMSYETLLRTRPPSLLRAALPASIYSSQYRKGSLTSLTDEIEHANALPRFVRDTSEYWYKPNISREEAINMLKDKAPGSFIVRNSTMFQGGFGLALRVAQMPPNVQVKGDDLQANLVRHFLIESGSKGVRLKGCSNEPAFGSLAALIYQHSITSLALPCRLILPVADALDETDKSDANTLQSSVCNTMYVESIDTESLTGPEALSRAITVVFDCGRLTPKATAVQFKVSHEGITLTDSKHRLFFRRHYPLNTISFCGMDGIDRRLIFNGEENVVVCGKLFGFVARKSGNNSENASHLFLNPENNQSTSTIVDMVTKVMMGQG